MCLFMGQRRVRLLYSVRPLARTPCLAAHGACAAFCLQWRPVSLLITDCYGPDSMLDPKLLRSDLDMVAQRLATRGFVLDTERLEALESRRRELRTERSEEHTSELQSRFDLVCRLLLEKKNAYATINTTY